MHVLLAANVATSDTLESGKSEKDVLERLLRVCQHEKVPSGDLCVL